MNEELSQYCKGYCELHFDPQTSQTIQFLKELFSSYTNRVYIVGGFVRDQYMQLDRSNDIDIEVYDLQPEQFDQIMQSIGALGVGQSFFVYKYQNIDISLPRTESKTGYGHTGFDVQLANDEKLAAKRRDFTMNALMVDIFTNKLYDFFGGIEDIKKKKITIIDEESFKEDSLRILRAMRFASTFGFKIEKNSCQIMQQLSIDDLSNERIVNEFMKMFETKFLHYGLYYCISLNIATQFFDVVIEKRVFIDIYKLMRNNRQFFNDKLYRYYFLYILNSFVAIDIQKSGFPNKLTKEINKHKKYQDKIELNDLFIIALDMPICDWLGAINESIIDTAKLHNIFENRLETNINVQDVIADGFEKETIKLELQRRRIKFINDKIIDLF